MNRRETALRAYNRVHGTGWPQTLHVTTDQHTAWFVTDDEDDVRDLLDRAGVYRRRFDLDYRYWSIPVGELEGVIAYARRYNGRAVVIDNEFPLVPDSRWSA